MAHMFLWLPLAAVMAGCTATQFLVHVHDVRRTPIAHASVLFYDAEFSPCYGGASAGERTDEAGIAGIEARSCGQERMLVTAEGFKPLTRVLDTCPQKPVFVELEKRAEEPHNATETIATTARAFLGAVAGRDGNLLRQLLVDPNDATLYEEEGLDRGGRQCEMRFVRTLAGEEDQRVEFSLDCTQGCHKLWQVHMLRVSDEWRVRSLTPMTADYQMP